MYIPLDKAKQHINVDAEYKEDDGYIISLVCAAEDAVAKRLNVKSLSKLVNPDTGYLPDSVSHAILLLIGNWFANREAVSNLNLNKLSYGFDFLADLNRNYNEEPF